MLVRMKLICTRSKGKGQAELRRRPMDDVSSQVRLFLGDSGAIDLFYIQVKWTGWK